MVVVWAPHWTTLPRGPFCNEVHMSCGFNAYHFVCAHSLARLNGDLLCQCTSNSRFLFIDLESSILRHTTRLTDYRLLSSVSPLSLLPFPSVVSPPLFLYSSLSSLLFFSVTLHSSKTFKVSGLRTTNDWRFVLCAFMFCWPSSSRSVRREQSKERNCVLLDTVEYFETFSVLCWCRDSRFAPNCLPFTQVNTCGPQRMFLVLQMKDIHSLYLSVSFLSDADTNHYYTTLGKWSACVSLNEGDWERVVALCGIVDGPAWFLFGIGPDV